ncbi:Rne/Rng family ribonuclease [Tepidibacter aestuarii]|uniref:Rne/Rng family ribonuclease n=1 Tax=Tepidibacter aestuarii TaxID=2925782 RepID=UPI0020C17DA9|nr:Rne/Rng family ribonuclease [Tepidibacter aestuarii]CAH2214185.1 Ribonuclease G [Tepidibacter aestuarii]
MKSLLVDVALYQSKVAYVEDGKVVDLFIEDKMNEKLQGRIYRGIVKNVLLGMEAAFVDIGIDKNAYLKLSKGHNIKTGQEVLVQVNKEAIKDKGPKITQEISIPGRYLVLMPTRDDIAISNKIKDKEEIKRIKSIVDEIGTKGMGLIIRTEAIDKQEIDFKDDLNELFKIWDEIQKYNKLGMGSRLLYKDLDLTLKVIRDIFTPDFEKIIVNNKQEYEKVVDVLTKIDKSFKNKVEHFDEGLDLFDYYKIKKDLKTALNRKVWLKNGAYIIIDKTEAMTVIDVNTGKFTGKLGLDETVFKTNLEACKEIARQIRLRNVAGIIIIDFIDMRNDNYKQQILKKLQIYLNKDKTRAQVLGMTNLGLVEVVRKKSNDTLDKYFEAQCIYCSGQGSLKSKNKILSDIEKEIIRLKKHTSLEKVLFKSSNYIFNIAKKDDFKHIKEISKYYEINIEISEDKDLNPNDIITIY